MTQYLKPEDEKQNITFNPSKKYIDTVNRVYQRFTDMKTERDKVRREFDYRTLKEYVQDGMDAYNGIVSDEVRASKEDWQSMMWDHETRGKVKTLLSMIVSSRPFISLIGENDSDNDYANDLFDVYEDTHRKENGQYKLYLQALSAACKGTVIVEEIYQEEKRTIKEINKIDHETGQISFIEKDIIVGGYGHVKANIVNLLDFYPNENSPDIKHDCCVLKLYTRKAFLNKYGKYPHANLVSEGIWGGDFDDIEYRSVSSNKDELIEVIRYYNEDYDEFVILANGVWLNPQIADAIAPIPFDHHRLPFAKTVCELADENCFYGKHFPDLLSGEQETRNALLRVMIDQEILAINKPILAGAGFEIDSTELYPGKIVKATGPLADIREMQMSGSTQSSFQLLQLLKRNSNENSSIDTVSQGVSSGGRKTAREAVILDENAKRISGTFQLFMYKLLWDRAELRIANIQQFYTQPVQYNVLKDKYGKPQIGLNGQPQVEPVMRKVPVLKPGKKPKWIEMKPEMRYAKLNVWLVEDYETALNKSARVEFASALLAEAKQNPLLSADEATLDYLQALGKNPERFYIKPKPQEMQMAAEGAIPQHNPAPPVNTNIQ